MVDGIEPMDVPGDYIQPYIFDDLYRKTIHRDSETLGMEICMPVWKHRAFIDAHRYDHAAVTTMLLVTTEETQLEHLIARKVAAGDVGAVANTIVVMGSERVGNRLGADALRGQAPGQRQERRDRGVPRHRAGLRAAAEPHGPGRAAPAPAPQLSPAALPPRALGAERRWPSSRRSGLCSTFHRFPEGLALPLGGGGGPGRSRAGRAARTTTTGIGLTWELKDVLPARRQVYYGKLVKGRPLLVALDLFPAFYALVRGRAAGARLPQKSTRRAASRSPPSASWTASCASRPQYTRGIRAECFMLEPGKTREFERAMGELQQGLWIVKTEERYEPTFSYRWDLLERWLPEAVAEGRRLRRAGRARAAARALPRPAPCTRRPRCSRGSSASRAARWRRRWRPWRGRAA